MTKKGRFVTIIILILLGIFYAEGISKTKTSTTQKPIFQSLGTVVTVELENGFITIKDTDLPFWLKAMTMRLPVKAKSFVNRISRNGSPKLVDNVNIV